MKYARRDNFLAYFLYTRIVLYKERTGIHMNVAVINLKDILKYFVKILIAIFIIFITMHYMSNSGQNLKETIQNKTSRKFLKSCLQISIPMLKVVEENDKHEIKITSLMNMEIAMLNPKMPKTEESNIQDSQINNEANLENPQVVETTVSPQVEISKIAETQEVSDKNFNPASNTYYGTTKIDNQSDYTLTEEMLVPDVEITNKTDVLIYHTHTCESYTASLRI